MVTSISTLISGPVLATPLSRAPGLTSRGQDGLTEPYGWLTAILPRTKAARATPGSRWMEVTSMPEWSQAATEKSKKPVWKSPKLATLWGSFFDLQGRAPTEADAPPVRSGLVSGNDGGLGKPGHA